MWLIVKLYFVFTEKEKILFLYERLFLQYRKGSNFQMRIQNPVEHLWLIVFAKIDLAINYFCKNTSS